MTVKLVRKPGSLTVPDSGNSISFIVIDEANPLVDEKGNPIMTSVPDGNGKPTPEYKEYVVTVPIPVDFDVTTGDLESLIDNGITETTERIASRIDGLTRRDILRDRLSTIFTARPVVEYEGNLPVKTIKEPRIVKTGEI